MNNDFLGQDPPLTKGGQGRDECDCGGGLVVAVLLLCGFVIGLVMGLLA